MNKAVWCKGCSFTFGEGLQYFSELPSINIPIGQTWYEEYLTHSQYKFIQNNRYSKLLANKLNTIDINSSQNGGGNESILNSLKSLLEPKRLHDLKRPYYIDEHYVNLNDIGLIVIQFTDLFRDEIEIDNILFPPARVVKSNDEFEKIIIKNGITFETFVKKVVEHTLNEFEIILKKIEEINPNIIIRVFNWFGELDEPLRSSKYFKDKVLTFNINGVKYTNFKEIIYANLGLTIQETFFPKCKNDQHFNLNGQKLIADTIYDSIRDEWETKVIN
jgi:hypothetical protein